MAITMCEDPHKCTTENKNSYAPCAAPTVTYTGRVLALRERNGYDDSDFYATVWDDETDAPRDVLYASTRGWTYHNGATIDATPEVRAKYDALCATLRAEAAAAAAEAEAKVPYEGRTVRSLTIRGKNVGITGIVRWYGPDQYKSTRWAKCYRVGIAVEGESKLRYMDADRVEVVAD